tara:strand:- start:435 stop:983 length:549 start_codon:yes stop_codon:yes gene_type:complete
MPEMPLDNFSRVLLKKREVFDSEIGYFTNTYTPKIKKGSFVQDSISFIRKKATVKGLHFQKAPFAQAKIVTVLAGEIVDYFVDLRPSSKTYLDYGKIIISQENKRVLFIPRGFAHGYITTKANTMISYKVDNEYSPDHERTINWQDKVLDINWPKYNQYFLSKKDKLAKNLKDHNLKKYENI